MRIRVNKAHFPVTVLGPGRRIGLWMQGCCIRCPGCISRDTWEPDPATEIEVESVLEWCRSFSSECPDGVTISGGEPFDQPEALGLLLDGLAAWRTSLATPLDLLCYSGYSLRVLRARHSDLLTKLDVIIPEPFVAGRQSDVALVGSANQCIVPLSALGTERFGKGTFAKQGRGRLQMTVTDTTVWLIGIPTSDDLDAMAAACAGEGVLLQGVSWRA